MSNFEISHLKAKELGLISSLSYVSKTLSDFEIHTTLYFFAHSIAKALPSPAPDPVIITVSIFSFNFKLLVKQTL